MSISWAVIKDAIGWVWTVASRPRLELYFDPAMTCHTATDLAFSGAQGMFLHVMVVNRGRKSVKKCRGLLAQVYAETRPGVFEAAQPFHNPVELHWAHEPIDCFIKDIPPDEPTRLDVCYAHESNPMLHFFCEKRPRGVQTDFPPGKYKIRIRICSEEGAMCSRRFLIAFDGNFRKLYLEQLSE